MRAGQIFFSYSRVDAKFALKLGEDLRKAGIDIWIDQIDIPPSAPWDEEIEKALKESDCMLVILSQTSVASDNVLNEIDYALDSKKQVLPIVIEEGIKKPLNIIRLQHIDFTDSYDTGLHQLLSSLSSEKPVPVKEKAPSRMTMRVAIIAGMVLITMAILSIIFYKYDPGKVSTKNNGNPDNIISTESFSSRFNGKWLTPELTNPFDTNDSYKIGLDLEVMGDVIIGTINFTSTNKDYGYVRKKGFLEGKIKNNVISFYTLEQSVIDSKNITYKDFYNGNFIKDEIIFTLQSDRPWGFPGQKFVAKRTH